LVPLTGFIDAGNTGGPIMSVAAWIGRVEKWSVFDDVWRLRREQAGVNKKFHTAPYMARDHEYADWPEEKRHNLINWLLSLTEGCVLLGLSISVDLTEYTALWPDLPPYFYGASQLVNAVAYRLEGMGIKDHISYVYDDGDLDSLDFKDAMTDLALLGERYRDMFRIHSIVPGSGSTWPALDAADYLAWVGWKGPGYYRGRVQRFAEFWDIRGDVLKQVLEASDPLRDLKSVNGEFPELLQIHEKWIQREAARQAKEARRRKKKKTEMQSSQYPAMAGRRAVR